MYDHCLFLPRISGPSEQDSVKLADRESYIIILNGKELDKAKKRRKVIREYEGVLVGGGRKIEKRKKK